MKLRYNFEIVKIDDESIAIPLETEKNKYHGVLKLNETGATIIQYLNNGYNEATIIEKLMAHYSSTKEELTKNVQEFLSILISKGLIDK